MIKTVRALARNLAERPNSDGVLDSEAVSIFALLHRRQENHGILLIVWGISDWWHLVSFFQQCQHMKFWQSWAHMSLHIATWIKTVLSAMKVLQYFSYLICLLTVAESRWNSLEIAVASRAKRSPLAACTIRINSAWSSGCHPPLAPVAAWNDSYSNTSGSKSLPSYRLMDGFILVLRTLHWLGENFVCLI